MNTHYHHALVYYYNHSSSGSWSITLDKLASDSTNVGVPFVASFPFLFLDFRCWASSCPSSSPTAKIIWVGTESLMVVLTNRWLLMPWSKWLGG
jgi:hypothetical protein